MILIIIIIIIYTSNFSPKFSIFINKIIKFTNTLRINIYSCFNLFRFCKLNDYILYDYNKHILFLTSLLITKKYN